MGNVQLLREILAKQIFTKKTGKGREGASVSLDISSTQPHSLIIGQLSFQLHEIMLILTAFHLFMALRIRFSPLDYTVPGVEVLL